MAKPLLVSPTTVGVFLPTGEDTGLEKVLRIVQMGHL